MGSQVCQDGVPYNFCSVRDIHSQQHSTVTPVLAQMHIFVIGEKLASTMQGEQEDIDRAVGAAREAFKSWSKS